MPSQPASRRQFLKQTAVASAAISAVSIVPRHVLGQGQTPPSEKVNIAAIGIGGMGFRDTKNFGDLANILAICDVDERHIANAQKNWPGAKPHTDFREMFDEQKNIDAVTIATPDHCHAAVTMMALKLGKHTHCQKPLTHTVYEARMVYEAAKAAKVATQMGNFGHASEGHRLICEIIWDGAIGPVREVHSWSNRHPDISQRAVPRPKETPPCPKEMHWDLWLGPSAERPYHPCYHPFAWRGWWDFGSGVLGDIGCHEWSPVFKALKLGHPTTVEASSTHYNAPPEVTRETAPLASMIRYDFPADGDRAAVSLNWYDGGMRPPRPDELEPELRFGVDDGTLIVGDKGKIFNGRLIPETRRKSYGKPPQKLPRSPGHYVEFINACKGGKDRCGSDFVDHAAHLAEIVQLGNVAIKANRKIRWNPEKLECTGDADATALLRMPYRAGYSL